MANGRVHSGDCVLIGSLGGIIAYQAGVPLVSCITFLFGSLVGVLLSPDLDQDGLTNSETVVFRRFRILGHTFFLYWYIYAVALKHRSPWSHFPILGTALRLAYLSPLWWLLFVFIGLPVPDLAVPAVVGLAVADLLHFLRDGKRRKKRKRGKKKRKRYQLALLTRGVQT